jgi:CubicO group peptidase (beta-lactamase class C family)
MCFSRKPLRRGGAALSLLVVFAFSALQGNTLEAAPEDLNSVLEPLRTKHRVPALAAAAMRGTDLLGAGAVGTRKIDGREIVTIDDQWHIGSCTKSMTATLAAMFVEQGQIKWQTTVGEIFTDLEDTMDPQWSAVTLEQLLSHRGGAPAEAPPNLWRNAARQQGSPRDQRREFVKGLLMRRPESEPGAKYNYSNQGYAIAGVMLERVSGQPWEKLMQTMLFPIALMSDAGFGAPATRGRTDHPWGHTAEGQKLVPVPPGPNADNPPAIGPAGTVHCSIKELVRYAAWHARGEARGTPTLKRESFVKLHMPVAGGDYALGWSVHPRGWAGGNALSHAGSNTMFYAVIWIAPAKDIAFVAATNCATEGATKACDEAVAAMVTRWVK